MKRSMLLAAVLLSLSFSAAAEDELMVSISSSGAMAQGAGLVLATQAVEQKAVVRVLLCDAAAYIALVGAQLPVLKPRNVTAQQMLQGLIKSGVKVEVCALYLPNTGRKPTDLVSGVTPAKPAEVATHLLRSEVKVLSF